MKNNFIVIAVLLSIVAVGGGFFVGVKYQQRNSPVKSDFGNAQDFRNRMGTGKGVGAGARNNGFSPVNGEIISSDDKSITVKLAEGSSKIVVVTEKTSINKASEGTREDLITGEKVVVFGQINSDGTVTAENIQLNPLERNLPSPQPNQ